MRAACALLALSLLVAAPAHAQPSALGVTVADETGALDPAEVRGRLAEALERPIVERSDETPPHLLVAVRDGQLRLRYRDAGRVRARETDAPRDPEELLRVLTLLARNLVRDEAAELLALLGDPESEAEAESEVEVEVEVESEAEAESESESEAEAESESEPITEPEEPAPAPGPEDGWRPPPRPYVPVGIDLLPGVGVSSGYGGSERRAFSLGVIADLYGGLDGYAFGGFATLGGDVVGVQQSVGLAVAERVRGVQLGVVGVALHLEGAQLGAFNVSGGGEGAQIGFVNVASVLRGPQVGILNIGDRADVGVGIINIYAQGRTQLEVTGDSGGLLRLAVKHGAGWWHSVYTVASNPFYGEVALMVGLGFGARAEITDALHFDADLMTYYVVDTRWQPGTSFYSRVQLLAGVQVIDALDVVFGVGLDVFFTDVAGTPVYTPALDVRWDMNTTFWPTLILGVQAGD